MTTFAYNDGVPATNNDPSVDQPDMLINTQSIKNLIDVDHISFGVANGGTHKQITLNRLAVKPPLAGTQVALYSKLVGSASELFFEYESGTELQLTGLNNSIAANGYTTLFGGLIIQWGSFTAIAGGNSSTTFPLNPFPNNLFSIAYSLRNAASVNDVDVYIRSQTTSGFTVRNSTGTNFTVSYIAIGN